MLNKRWQTSVTEFWMLLLAVTLVAPSALGQLASEGNQRWTQGSDGILDDAEGGDVFGAALVAGDFNGDGFADLAIGVPGENSARGRVNVIYGAFGGLTSSGNQRWTQGSDGILDDSEGGDVFGAALAAGDFNGDGFADLAIGVPGENSARGRVNVIYGAFGGLTSSGNQRWTQGSDGILDDSEGGDGFGAALAAGDFNGDGFADLAIGVPGENSARGRVNVIYGAFGGLTSNGNQRWTQGSDGILDDAEGGDVFGNDLAAGDFSSEGFDDLAIGVPGENSARGRVNVIYGVGVRPAVGGTVNGASFSTQPPTAGTIGSIFGTNLASTTLLADSLPLPTSLGGVSVQTNGIAAPLFFVSAGQINFQFPWESLDQTEVSITVTSNGVTSASQTIRLALFNPGIFAINSAGTGQGAILFANTVDLAAPTGSVPGRTSRPASPGDFLSIFCTGLGAVNNPPASGAPASADPLSQTTTTPSVTIGGVPATVTFSGLGPFFVGLYQVNVQVPDVPTGDAVRLVLTIGGVASNTVTIAVQ